MWYSDLSPPTPGSTPPGIQVHFVHVKPGVRAARPLMLIHGWPGSFYEFYKVIAQLTEPGAQLGGFEVVCPSIPGYGFSEAPRRPGESP